MYYYYYCSSQDIVIVALNTMLFLFTHDFARITLCSYSVLTCQTFVKAI